MTVKFSKDKDGWWYEVTGIQSAEYGSTYACGPFIFKFLARLKLERELINLV